MRNRSWMTFLVVGSVVTAIAAALGPTAQALAIVALGSCATWLSLEPARRFPGPIRQTWTYFGVAGAGIWIAGLVRVGLHHVVPAIPFFPSPADVLVAVAYAFLIAGTYRMGSIRSGRNRAAHLDGLIVATAAATVVWSLVLWPYLIDPASHVGARLVNGGFSVLTTILLAATIRLAVGPGLKTASYYLLAGAVAMVFVTDLGATLASVNGDRSSLTLLLGPIIYTFYGAAALHPAMPQMFEPPSARVLRLTRKRIVLLAGGLVVPPVTLVWGNLVEPNFDIRVIAVGSALLAILVSARFRLLVRAQEEAVEVQRIQRQANAHLAAASSRHAMYRAALRAVIDLADGLPDLRVSIAEVTGRSLRILDAVGQHAGPAIGLVLGLDDLPSAVVDGMAQLEVSNAVLDRSLDLPPGIGPEGTVHTLVAPLRSQQGLNGALIVTARRPVSLSTRQTIEALASTVSLALESAVLTENLMRRRSERRFRALVENSSDIVLVVDPQRTITFASPAAHRLLGLSDKDLIGSHPARWVHPDDWSALARAFAAGDHPAQADGDEVEIRIRHVNGTHRWFEVRLRDLAHDPEIRGMVVTAREVSDRKATEQQLAASEARF
ncbi:MAG: PAS domain-containing protein, partial [Acidimicrobiales bacterium]